VEAVREASGVPRQRLVLIQAFGKGAKVDSIVRDATVLDASELWIVSTIRSAVSGTLDTPGRMQRWVKIATEAARQCERGNIPKILGVVELDAALEESVKACQSHKWLLSPSADMRFGEALVASNGVAEALLIGPEGGFAEEESARARAVGFVEVRLGSRVLRSETAATAALGAIAAFRDR